MMIINNIYLNLYDYNLLLTNQITKGTILINIENIDRYEEYIEENIDSERTSERSE
jgi:hypothetical protein